MGSIPSTFAKLRNIMIEEHVNSLLGRKAVDKVTGTKGTITSISFDLYGCVQGLLSENINQSYWLDITRLKVMSSKPVMELPNFTKGYVAEGRKGPAEKPTP
jgi:hypothetical protein